MKDCYTLKDLRRWRKTEPPIRLGVLGDPIAHSLSPRMQNAALVATGKRMRYAAFRIAPDELLEALSLLAKLNFVGVNLTAPHKRAAVGWVDELSPSAQRAQSVNTICFRDEKLIGFNTDGAGFARAIREEFGGKLNELRVLLLGARGGAGRAIAQKCPQLLTLERGWSAKELRAGLAASDLVVNATPLSFEEIFGSTKLDPRVMLYDVNYTRPPLRGMRSANGRSMLLHQGALAFEKWFGRRAPLEVMRAALEPSRVRAR